MRGGGGGCRWPRGLDSPVSDWRRCSGWRTEPDQQATLCIALKWNINSNKRLTLKWTNKQTESKDRRQDLTCLLPWWWRHPLRLPAIQCISSVTAHLAGKKTRSGGWGRKRHSFCRRSRWILPVCESRQHDVIANKLYIYTCMPQSPEWKSRGRCPGCCSAL